MKLKEIQNLIKFVAKSGANEVSLEMEDVKITIKTSSGTPPIVVQEPIVVPHQPNSPVSIPNPDTIETKSETTCRPGAGGIFDSQMIFRVPNNLSNA